MLGGLTCTMALLSSLFSSPVASQTFALEVGAQADEKRREEAKHPRDMRSEPVAPSGKGLKVWLRAAPNDLLPLPPTAPHVPTEETAQPCCPSEAVLD